MVTEYHPHVDKQVDGKRQSVNSIEKMQPIVHQTLSARVYQDLRELIISGQLQPGQRLTLAGMATALGTSVMPVREAINKLAADDALEILPNKSVRVPLITRARFQELVVIRVVVEGLAVETAAARITAAQLKTLAGLEQVRPDLASEFAFLRYRGSLRLTRPGKMAKELVRPLWQWRSRSNIYLWLHKVS